MKLPRVSGRNLLRRRMTFPDDFGGQLNLIFIPFQRWHQELVDGWVPFVKTLAAEHPGFEYYEFPTLPEAGPIYRTMLNEGMRAGIPNPDTRARTITLYINKGAFRRALGIDSEETIWLFLCRPSGEVVWQEKGEFEPDKGEALRAQLAEPAA